MSFQSVEAPSTKANSKYRPDIDGMRAIAVLAVLLYHFHLGLPGGFIGVDIFFVISGFLITRVILQRDQTMGWLRYLGVFFTRRVRRLYPALIVVSFLSILGGYYFLGNEPRLHMAYAAMAQVLFSSNVYFFSEAGYFGPDSDSLVLLHYWSLSVEEQFYLIYPGALLALVALGKRWVHFILGAVLLASLALSVGITRDAPSFSFYMLPTRAWELLLGAGLTLGWLPMIRSRRVAELAALVGLTLMIVPMFTYGKTTVFPGIAALPPCLGTILLIHAHTCQTTLFERVLVARPTVFVGLISYSVYLVHWPIASIVTYASFEAPGVMARVGMAALSLVLGWLSWLVVETPVRKRWILESTRWLMLGSLLASLALIALCMVVVQRNSIDKEGYVQDVQMAEVRAGRLPRIGAAQSADSRPELLLWGDSHSQMVATELSRMLADAGKFGYAAIGHASIPLLDAWVGTLDRPDEQLMERNRLLLEFVKKHRPRHVLFVATWGPYLMGENGERLLDSKCTEETVAMSRVAFHRSLERTVRELEAIGCQVWTMKSVPNQRDSIPRLLKAAESRNIPFDEVGVTLDEHRAAQSVPDAVIDEISRATKMRTLDPVQFLVLPNGHTRVAVDGMPAYIDNTHIDPERGAPLLREMFAVILTTN